MYIWQLYFFKVTQTIDDYQKFAAGYTEKDVEHLDLPGQELHSALHFIFEHIWPLR